MGIAGFVKRAWAGVENEIDARGGLFGMAGHHAKAFANVLGENPAASSVIAGIGTLIGTTAATGDLHTGVKAGLVAALGTLSVGIVSGPSRHTALRSAPVAGRDI